MKRSQLLSNTWSAFQMPILKQKTINYELKRVFCSFEDANGTRLLQCVEILVLGVYENPLLSREVHTLGRTMLIMFLDRRNSETAEQADKSMLRYGLFGNLGVYLVNESS